jgi:nickel-dependent lactate racemase
MSEEGRRGAEVTLEDLDAAIRIIEVFLARVERAKRIARRLSRELGGRVRPEDVIAQVALGQVLGRQATEEEVEEPELSPEELERIRRRARELAKRA